MTDNTRICPRCNGCGNVAELRKRMISPDPNMKWCGMCKKFLERSEFYKATTYCKRCHCAKTGSRSCDKRNIKVHEKRCPVCGITFLGRKKQRHCSRRCNCEDLNQKRKLNAANSLPNDLREQVLGDNFTY